MEIKIITKYWGKIDPLKIEEYVAIGGYWSLKKFIREMDGNGAISEIKKSGLAGRGGAGFLMGDKLAMVAASPEKVKYFICNLDESEPGTYKDRSIVDNNPHLLIEGIIISSLSIGAREAFIYINGNYKKQAEILERSLKQAEENNYLGNDILGSGYGLKIEIFRGAGAYVCGEETALINSMEGNRGEPKLRPPYPTEVGYLGKPTAVNNAETISNVPWIINNGGEAYAKVGSSESPGTKLYILGGAVKNLGVFEGLTGMTVREVISTFGGGLKEGKKMWFAQVGGASGRLVTKDELDTPLTFSRNQKIPLGSGSILVVDTTCKLNEIILSWMDFFRRESCGKCVPCREGTFRLFEIAKRLQDGEISPEDEKAIGDIIWTLNNTTFCPLGKFAATAFQDAIEKL
jgi:NADH:ubiquinone oxidoreductase subunit F (NADH-binding)